MLQLIETGLGLFEVGGRLVALGSEAGKLLALVAVLIAARLGFRFPLLATVFDFGELTHDRLALMGSGGGGSRGHLG